MVGKPIYLIFNIFESLFSSSQRSPVGSRVSRESIPVCVCADCVDLDTEESSRESLKRRNYDAYVEMIVKKVREQEQDMALAISGVQSRNMQKLISRRERRGLRGGKSPARARRTAGIQSLPKSAADVSSGYSVSSEHCVSGTDGKSRASSSARLSQSQLEFTTGPGMTSVGLSSDVRSIISSLKDKHPCHLYFLSNLPSTAAGAEVFPGIALGEKRVALDYASSPVSLGMSVPSLSVLGHLPSFTQAGVVEAMHTHCTIKSHCFSSVSMKNAAEEPEETLKFDQTSYKGVSLNGTTTNCIPAGTWFNMVGSKHPQIILPSSRVTRDKSAWTVGERRSLRRYSSLSFFHSVLTLKTSLSFSPFLFSFSGILQHLNSLLRLTHKTRIIN